MMPRRYASSHCVLGKKEYSPRRHEGHEGLEVMYISMSYFVLFATFVVKMSGSSFGCAPCGAVLFVCE